MGAVTKYYDKWKDQSISTLGEAVCNQLDLRLNKAKDTYIFMSYKIIEKNKKLKAEGKKTKNPIVKKIYATKLGLYDHNYQEIGIGKGRNVKVNIHNSRWVYAIDKKGRNFINGGIPISNWASKNYAGDKDKKGRKYSKIKRFTKCRTRLIVLMESSDYANFICHDEYIQFGKVGIYLQCEGYDVEIDGWDKLPPEFIIDTNAEYKTLREKNERNGLIYKLRDDFQIPSRLISILFNMSISQVDKIISNNKQEGLCMIDYTKGGR